MVDKKLKHEKKMFRYTDRVIKRGIGWNQIPEKWKNKKNVVPYWTQDGGDFISWDKNKFQMFLSKLRWKLRYIFVIRLYRDIIKKSYWGSE